jgi:enoyl-CoA hydratase
MTERSEVLRVEDDGGLRVLTLNRPSVMNAVNGELAHAIDKALFEVDDDPRVRVAIITGAGPHFCVGADLKAISVEGVRVRIEDRGFAGIARRNRVKPLIAAVEGMALGGGFEICLAADMVTAAAGATFALPEVRWSRLAAGGGVLRFGRTLPTALAMEIGLTGARLSAARAAELGLVNRVTPEGGALAAATELAEAVCAGAPLSVAASRRIITAAATRPEDEVWDLTWAEQEIIRASADSREGILAFVEKRPPRWLGR